MVDSRRADSRAGCPKKGVGLVLNLRN
jgi:hypothetical protein